MHAKQWIPLGQTSQTILKVDDNDDECLLFRAAAEFAGIVSNLQTVSDGETAVDYLEGRNSWSDRSRFPFPNLVLLDLHMPRMDGFAVLRYIRGRWDFQELPVIIFSASENPDNVRDARRFGANGFLGKPGDFDDLIETVRSLDQMSGQRWWPSGFLSKDVCHREPDALFGT